MLTGNCHDQRIDSLGEQHNTGGQWSCVLPQKVFSAPVQKQSILRRFSTCVKRDDIAPIGAGRIVEAAVAGTQG